MPTASSSYSPVIEPRHRPWKSAGLALATAIASWSLGGALAAGDAIDPNFLALKDCPAEHGCPAVVLLDETELNNESNRSRFTRRRMTKLFTQEGIERYADVTLPAAVGGWDVRNLQGRTILPDGTTIQLKQDNVSVKYLRQGKRHSRVKSATFPGVVPGAIIEWSFDILLDARTFITEDTWDLQQDLPVLTTKYTLKQGPLAMAWGASGLEKVGFTHTNPFKNVNYFNAVNVPGVPDEPLAPSDDALRSRLYFYLPEVQQSWIGVMLGKISGRAGAFTEQAPGIADKVKELVLSADSATEKVRKIYRFVQERIATEEQRADETSEAKSKDAEHAGDVLSRGFGDEYERTLLFLALVKEAGLENGLLVVKSRYGGPLNVEIPDENQFDSYAAAVKTELGWTFYDPAVRHCPFGMISAEKEGGVNNAALVHPQKGAGRPREGKIQNLLFTTSDPVPYALVGIPYSAAAKNVLQRDATVTVGPDGSVELECSEKGTGLADLDLRAPYEGRDETARKQALEERLSKELPGAKLTGVSFEDLDSFDKQARITYKLALPGEAAAAPDRILLTPSLFNVGRPNPFTAETRRSAVLFPHAQRTIERTTIAIPSGHAAADLPAPIVVRDPPFLLTANWSLDGTNVIFTRRLEIDAATWPAADYPRLKAFFAKVQEADRQVLVLKKAPS
ncbi:MAG TPA: DUF3857 domain-containing protein [Candidatus Polarisedimenticolia bacterium]|nr:DUF3857 domain-containing protein [Candidatus Polarisedimenticolia bacterium]